MTRPARRRRGLRLFRCCCNHKLRLGAATCGYCFRATPLWNRWWAVGLMALALGAALWTAVA